MITVVKITNPEDLKRAFAIRNNVFVIEQKVKKEEEFDEFDDSSHHFLALDENGVAIGTARWRKTSKGIKLERFAVLPEYRGKRVGFQLVKKVLEDVRNNLSKTDKKIYLHSQLKAMPLYMKFGFTPMGEMFEECDILHYEMSLSV